MPIIHSILAAGYQPVRRINNILRRFGAKHKGRLRTLNYHDIVSNEQEQFENQIKWLSRTWTFVSPQQFSNMMRGVVPINGANLLLTFDDGFISGYRIAKEVLNRLGIQALFFVVTDFVDIAEKDNFRTFVSENIYPRMTPEAIPNHWRSMTWENLAWLIESGHSIGTHTRSHARLSELQSTSKLESEIFSSKNTLEQRLGTKIEHFAYPFGDLSSFSPEALNIARKQFEFIHTGLRGDNARGVPSWALRRDDVKPSFSFGLIGTFLEGGADIRYIRDINMFESWGKSIK